MGVYLKKDGKTFIRCYAIAVKFWDEFNASFVLLYFSNYRSIKTWHLFSENVEKNKNVRHLRLLFTYLNQNLSILRNILPWCSKEIVHVVFCILQINLYKALNIFCTLPKWIRNIPNIKTWMRILHVTQKTEELKSNKGNFTFPTHTADMIEL